MFVGYTRARFDSSRSPPIYKPEREARRELEATELKLCTPNYYFENGQPAYVFPPKEQITLYDDSFIGPLGPNEYRMSEFKWKFDVQDRIGGVADQAMPQ